MLVYKVTSPSGKCYIGITVQDFKERKYEHFKTAEKGYRKGKFQKAILKYKDLLDWQIIDNSAKTLEELCELEKYYIQLFDSYENGYNCTLGGEGNWGWKPSDEVKQKMSAWQKGRKFSEEHKEKLSKAKLGKKRGAYSKEHREKIAQGNGSKSFNVYKKETKEFVGTWNSYRQCSYDLNIYAQHIGKCLRKQKGFLSVQGYVFEYKGGVLS